MPLPRMGDSLPMDCGDGVFKRRELHTHRFQMFTLFSAPVETIDTKVPDFTPKEDFFPEDKGVIKVSPASEFGKEIEVVPSRGALVESIGDELIGLPAPTKNMQWVDWIDYDINSQVNTCTKIDMPATWSVTGFSEKYGSVISGFDDMGNKQKYYISDITDGDMLMTDGMTSFRNVSFVADWKREQIDKANKKRKEMINDGTIYGGKDDLLGRDSFFPVGDTTASENIPAHEGKGDIFTVDDIVIADF